MNTVVETIVLAKGQPTFWGSIQGWWLIYGVPAVQQAILPGLLVPIANWYAGNTGDDQDRWHA